MGPGRAGTWSLTSLPPPGVVPAREPWTAPAWSVRSPGAGGSPAAPHPGRAVHVLTWPHARRPRGRRMWVRSSGRRLGPAGPGPGTAAVPGPGETHVRQLQRPPDNASGDHGRLPPVTPGHLGRRGRLIPVSAL